MKCDKSIDSVETLSQISVNSSQSTSTRRHKRNEKVMYKKLIFIFNYKNTIIVYKNYRNQST